MIMKRCFFAFLTMILMWHGMSAQMPIYDSSRVYDIVTDTDDFYLFSMPKPCFNPCPYVWNPISRIVQEYVVTDTVTVYGVAIPLKNNTSNPIRDTISFYQALLMKKLGPFPGNNHGYSFENIDSVTLNRSHPRFCWFEYEDSCKHFLTAPCYEFYFDTPEQINRMTDTFYVGRYYCPPYVGYPDYSLHEYGGEYDPSISSTIYKSPKDMDIFYHCEGYQDKRWGVAFPIIGFRCGPIQWDTLDSYTGDNAVVRWRSVEEGTVYNVRLVGEDGSDTTYITSDTTFTFTQLSDSVRYNVMLRKQCHYATSNYDTTVYGQWRSTLSFGGNEGIVQPKEESFSLAPNPAQGSVQVVLPKSATGGQLSLCDLTGRELMVRTVVRTEMELDISTLPTGTYLVKLTTPQGDSTKRLVVAR